VFEDAEAVQNGIHSYLSYLIHLSNFMYLILKLITDCVAVERLICWRKKTVSYWKQLTNNRWRL